ncbi:MAG: type II toxin-antitoxin system VapC family toxin [Cyanobacteria bacterium]|nr:type II toxin-antitoxin system VapC family toxin [Cyanobacteriota bacterium]
MKFWDASAIVPLLAGQTQTAAMQEIIAGDSAITVWWGTFIECASAISRLSRDGDLDEAGVTAAFARLEALSMAWTEVETGSSLRATAVRMLRVHPLRAGDALQLASAFVAARGETGALDLVALDDRLAAAARKEGFRVLGLT